MMVSRIYEMALCGEYIAAYSDKMIRFYSRETGRESSLPVIFTSGVSALTYLPNRRWLLSGSVDGPTRTRLEPFSASEQTLQFTVTIAFPQGKKLKHLSLEPAIR